MQQSALRRMTHELPLGRDPAAVRHRIEGLERLLEGLFHVPVLGRRVGLDAIAGLVPVAGDTLSALVGLYLVWEARNLGMSKSQIARMAGRTGMDWLLGTIPLAGDLFDFFYSSNTRNLKTIRRHLDRHHPATKIIEG